MVGFSRSNPDEARATDEVATALQSYRDGTTFEKLMQDHKERFKDGSSILAAIDLLIQEGKVTLLFSKK
jgi:hypothetical protein